MTVNNYIKFYKIVDEHKMQETSNFLASEDFFDFEGYLKFQEGRSLKNNDNNIEFIRQLVATQGFHKFIE